MSKTQALDRRFPQTKEHLGLSFYKEITHGDEMLSLSQNDRRLCRFPLVTIVVYNILM